MAKNAKDKSMSLMDFLSLDPEEVKEDGDEEGISMMDFLNTSAPPPSNSKQSTPSKSSESSRRKPARATPESSSKSVKQPSKHSDELTRTSSSPVIVTHGDGISSAISASTPNLVRKPARSTPASPFASLKAHALKLRKEQRSIQNRTSTRGKVYSNISTWAPPELQNPNAAESLVQSARQRHSCSCTRSHLVIYGGCNNQGTAPANNLVLYNLKSKKWTCPNPTYFGMASQSPKSTKATIHKRGPSDSKPPIPTIPLPSVTAGSPPSVLQQSFSKELAQAMIRRTNSRDLLMKTSAPSSMDSRYSHSAIVYTNCVYIFAGFSVRDNVLTDSIIRFSPETNEWEYIDVAGKVPPKRKGHAAAAVKNNMYIFGGVDESDKLLNDMWRFNFDSKTWNEVVLTGDIPTPRYFHAMTSNNTRIYLYGGFNGTKEFGDLYAFNPSSNSFTRLENTSSKDTTKPPPKQGHSLTLIGLSLYLVGGTSTSDDKGLDCYVCDLQDHLWYQINYEVDQYPADKLPEKHNRRFHAATHNAATRNHQILLFGGTIVQNSAKLDQLTFVIDTGAQEIDSASQGDKSSLNSLPQREWEAAAMAVHPDILALRERLRGFSGLDSYGRFPSNHGSMTLSPQALSSNDVLQLVMDWLASEGYKKSLVKLQDETNETYIREYETRKSALESLLSLFKRKLKINTSIWSDEVYDMSVTPDIIDKRSKSTTIIEEENEDPAAALEIWEEQDPSNIRIEGMLVFAGTLTTLVQLLVDYESFVQFMDDDDERYVEEYRLCFFHMLNSFTTPDILLQKLQQLYEVPDEVDEDNAFIRQHHSAVMALLRFWVESCPWDWTKQKIQQEAIVFIEKFNGSAGVNTDSTKELVNAVRRLPPIRSRKDGIVLESGGSESSASAQASLTSNGGVSTISIRRGSVIARNLAAEAAREEAGQTPDPIVPKNIFSPRLTFDELSELCNKWWTSDEAEYRSPIVLQSLRRAENISRWVQFYILNQENSKARTKAFDKMVSLCGHLRDLLNFENHAAVLRALTAPTVSNFAVSHKKTLDSWVKLLQRSAPGAESYTTLIQLAQDRGLPCIPVLQNYLDDIEKHEVNLADFDSQGRINFHKRRFIHNVMMTMSVFQFKKYNLSPVLQIALLLRFHDVPKEDDLLIFAATRNNLLS